MLPSILIAQVANLEKKKKKVLVSIKDITYKHSSWYQEFPL